MALRRLLVDFTAAALPHVDLVGVRRETLGLESRLESLRQARLVIHDQESHGPVVAHRG